MNWAKRWLGAHKYTTLAAAIVAVAVIAAGGCTVSGTTHSDGHHCDRTVVWSHDVNNLVVKIKANSCGQPIWAVVRCPWKTKGTTTYTTPKGRIARKIGEASHIYCPQNSGEPAAYEWQWRGGGVVHTALIP